MGCETFYYLGKLNLNLKIVVDRFCLARRTLNIDSGQYM